MSPTDLMVIKSVRRLTFSTLVVLGLSTLLAPAPSSDGPDNWQRLHAMPPELRNQLADQLKAFDLLDRGEKEGVRALDQKIGAEPEENRLLYYGVLQRYHAWVQSLTETQRNELSAAPPETRWALVTKIVADRKTKSAEKFEPSVFHYADFGGVSPFELAERIKAWMVMTDEEKAEVNKLDPADRMKRMSRFVQDKKTHLKRPEPAKLDAAYKRALDSGRFPFLKKAEESKDAKKQANIKRRFVDNYFYVENPPSKVSPENLLRFERSLPAWIRGGFDTLPPDEARRRLAILYRLVYPSGEIGAATAKVSTTKPAEAAPVPAPPAPEPPKASTSRPY